MKFGMPTLIEFGSIEENIALCKELRLDFIELNMNMPQYQSDRLLSDIERYKSLCKETGIYYTIHLDENFSFADFEPAVRSGYLDTLKSVIVFAKELHTPVINFHMPQGVHFTLPDIKVYLFEKYSFEFGKALSEFLAICENRISDDDITVCIENTDGYLPFQQSAIDYLLLSPRFGLTWDVGHSYAACNRDNAFLLEHSSRLNHFHIHDASGKSNHLALGTGEIDIPLFLKLAEERSCRCVIETKTSSALRESVQYLTDIGIIG